MKRNNHKLFLLTAAAVMTALVCVMTLSVKIPSPTKGYLNLGDCFVLLSGWLLGPVYGTLAGGIGSALADLIAGYPVYIPGTFLIKALMSFTAARLAAAVAGSGQKHLRAGWIAGAAAAECIMVCGYYLYAAIVIGAGFLAAAAGIVGNVMQGLVGALGAYFLAELLHRSGAYRVIRANGTMK